MNKLFALSILVLSLLAPQAVFAGTLADVNGAEFDLNQASPGAMAKHLLGSTIHKSRQHVMKATYSFAVQGGATTANITLLNGVTGKAAILPNKAIIRNCVIDTLTAPTSTGSATISISPGQTTGDLKAATAYGSFTGLVACTPVGSAATSIKLTADRTMLMRINTAALTAGKLNVLVEYDISE